MIRGEAETKGSEINGVRNLKVELKFGSSSRIVSATAGQG
jgi:hypothetical protein